MNWEQRYCPNRSCTDRNWMVQRNSTMCDVWWVAANEDEYPFTIAATYPVCPECGTTLPTLGELDSGLDRQTGADVGPIFDFVRSLP
jgi:hypothetical protein